MIYLGEIQGVECPYFWLGYSIKNDIAIFRSISKKIKPDCYDLHMDFKYLNSTKNFYKNHHIDSLGYYQALILAEKYIYLL